MDIFVDYYELLHVQPSAPAPVIKASYRTMMQKLNHHPDRGGEVGFAQLLNDAVKTLCDPRTRAQYDVLRKQFESNTSEDEGDEPSKSGVWGEPGGSPDPASSDTTQESENTGKHAGDPPHYSDTGTGNTTRPEHGYATLPSTPQCPFCLSAYPSDNHTVPSPAGYRRSRRCLGCNGARTPIAHLPSTSNEELRKMHRQHHETDVQLFMSWPCEAPLPCTLNDFSPAGCALIHSQAIDVGRVVMIETRLFNAICTVRHCKPSGKQTCFIGLEFVTLDMLAVPGSLLSATA